MDVHNREQRRRNMQAIRSRDTKAEVKLAKALWSKGYRYRKHDRALFGRPDLCFPKFRTVVFVDGAFFHGREWEEQKFRIKTNRDFWWKKIESNILRDQVVNDRLKKDNWQIIRFWDTEVLNNLAYCINIFEKTVRKQRHYD